MAGVFVFIAVVVIAGAVLTGLTRRAAGRRTSKKNLRYAGYGRHGVPASHADPAFRTAGERLAEMQETAAREREPVPSHEEIMDIVRRLNET